MSDGLPEIESGDSFLGLYKNLSGISLLFTSTGISVGGVDGNWGAIVLYSDIEAVAMASDKDSKIILLRCNDGRVVMVPVDRVVAGKFHDSLEVLRFFDRVVRDFRELSRG